MSELEKLAEDEREEFIKLHCTPPHELGAKELERLEYFASQIDFSKYAFEKRREEAARYNELVCTIITKEPYRLQTTWGVLELPEELVPAQLMKTPGDNYHPDILFACVSADIEAKKITSFSFREYLRKTTCDELAKVPILDTLPEADWPKR